jgi:hypothetical protein
LNSAWRISVRDTPNWSASFCSQFGAGLQAVLDDGAGQRFDDEAGGGGVHAAHDSCNSKKCIHLHAPLRCTPPPTITATLVKQFSLQQ